MYSSTPSLDSSLVLNDSGSSRTSPSRLPRMFVEYQPASPSMRALNAGASTVFIIVWPVLKSLPPIGSLRSSARCWSGGTSSGRVGDPVAQGRFSLSAAALGLALLHVGAGQPFYIVLVEGGGEGLDPLQKVRDRLQVLVPVQHAGLHRGGVGVIGNRVPGGEHQVLQVAEGHEFLDL